MHEFGPRPGDDRRPLDIDPAEAGRRESHHHPLEAGHRDEHVRPAADHPQRDLLLVAPLDHAAQRVAVDRLAEVGRRAAEAEPGVVRERLVPRHGHAEVVERRRRLGG